MSLSHTARDRVTWCLETGATAPLDRHFVDSRARLGTSVAALHRTVSSRGIPSEIVQAARYLPRTPFLPSKAIGWA